MFAMMTNNRAINMYDMSEHEEWNFLNKNFILTLSDIVLEDIRLEMF